MRLRVSVPVLSVQITVTAPIVSQACILRTRLFVRSMRRIDIASDRVIDIGSPSGTAMTMIATENMKSRSTSSTASRRDACPSSPASSVLTSSTRKMAAASAMPMRPMSCESRSSCRSSGVGSPLATVACSVTRPASVASPTAVTIATP